MGGYLLVSSLHRQAFASAAKHQLLAFLQVAAWTNRTAVMPYARVGEPAFVGSPSLAGFPDGGFVGLERYFDVADLKSRWPCLRMISYDAYLLERKTTVDYLVQLGFPPKFDGSVDAFGVSQNCGKRTRPLLALKAPFQCLTLAHATSALQSLGPSNAQWKDAAVMVTNWNQRTVGVGDATSPLFKDAFLNRGGCYKGRNDSFPNLAQNWHDKASDFVASALQKAPFVCAHFRAEKLASAATGREKQSQWRPLQSPPAPGAANEAFESPYMEMCIRDAAAIARHFAGAHSLVLVSDMDARRGTPSNQGSAHFREWRGRGERLLRSALPEGVQFCSRGDEFNDPAECAVADAAVCRRARHVLRFGSGTFSEFLVGDGPGAPSSTQFLNCSHMAAEARRLAEKPSKTGRGGRTFRNADQRGPARGRRRRDAG
ncbi:hypothetical protein M885DRAFT_527477 [Pelagophyceae sp. CCMP2097]|nr:hypothetical protein M885DRAFT_527477 [Pelagophyceae sp. CCMP2097]